MAQQGMQGLHQLTVEHSTGVTTYFELGEKSKVFSEKVQHPYIGSCIEKALNDFYLPVFRQKPPEEKRTIRDFRKSHGVTVWIDDHNTRVCPHMLRFIKSYVLEQLRGNNDFDRKTIASMGAKLSAYLEHVRLFNCSPH